MPSLLLPKGSRLIDALTVPNPAAVMAAGFGAYCPYLRNFTVAQRDAFWNEGIGLIPIQEETGTRALGGAAYARTDFTIAMHAAVAIGWDGTTPIDYSETDFDVQRSQFNVCDQYYGQIFDLHQNAGYVMPVVYGARAYINHLATWAPPGVYLWEAAGWKWATNTAADVTQLLGQESLPTLVDVDEVLTSLSVWVRDKPPDPPIPKGDAMANFLGYVTITDGDGNPIPNTYGSLVKGSDMMLYRYPTTGEGAGVFAFARGTVSQGSYDALPLFDPHADAVWFLSHGGGVSIPTNISLTGTLHA
jgi:hypothetical protein